VKDRSGYALELVERGKTPTNAMPRTCGGMAPMTKARQVFAKAYERLDLAPAGEHGLRAELARQIVARLESEALTQTAAAERLGISQPDVSRMLSGNFRQFSVERLMRFLVALGQDIEIRVHPAETGPSKGARITVTAG
jgi:predicted XRE-type DNA-binding protein